ncbi:MAG: histidine phosphatase family protein [Planctomycetaceae bacterium]
MDIALVIRPGETDFDREDRIQGALDLPLSADGQRQVARLIEQLRSRELDAVYTSPSQPSLATAELIADAFDLPLRELEGLANMDQGLWQGMLVCDLKRKHPRVYKQWQENPESVCAPAGETCEDAIDRVERALRKPMRKGGSFAIVVSEPLASIVSCVLQGEVARIPGPPASHHRAGTIEVIDPSITEETTVPAGFDSTDLIGF